jgi:hypothetical protein
VVLLEFAGTWRTLTEEEGTIENVEDPDHSQKRFSPGSILDVASRSSSVHAQIA